MLLLTARAVALFLLSAVAAWEPHAGVAAAEQQQQQQQQQHQHQPQQPASSAPAPAAPAAAPEAPVKPVMQQQSKRSGSVVVPRRHEPRAYNTSDTDAIITVDGTMTGGEVERAAVTTIATHTHGRLEALLSNTTTQACRDKVTHAFEQYMVAILQEQAQYLERHKFRSQCAAGAPRTPATTHGSSSPQQPHHRGPRGHPKTVRFLYLVLVHARPEQALRLVDALDEPGERHTFVIHVDARAPDPVQEALRRAAFARANVHVLEGAERVEVQWGGFSVCQATLNALAHALRLGVPFDWFWNLSGASYPLASNAAIRAAAARHPATTVFADISPVAHRATTGAWNRYVECDGRLHRIGRYFEPQGMPLHAGSQWFGAPPEVARWLLEDTEIVPVFSDYAAHITVADELFFSTLLLASPFCGAVVRDNFHHVEFGRRSDGDDARSGERCLMPDPRHCGRSPVTITLDYLPVLEHSGRLFARKFDARAHADVLDAIDALRRRADAAAANATHCSDRPSCSGGSGDPGGAGAVWGPSGEPLGPLQLVAHSGELCLAAGAPGHVASLVLCSAEDRAQHITVGACGRAGGRTAIVPAPLPLGLGKQCLAAVPAPAGLPALATLCPIAAAAPGGGGGAVCLDVEGESRSTGGALIWYKCNQRWNQLFAFGGESGGGGTSASVAAAAGAGGTAAAGGGDGSAASAVAAGRGAEAVGGGIGGKKGGDVALLCHVVMTVPTYFVREGGPPGPERLCLEVNGTRLVTGECSAASQEQQFTVSLLPPGVAAAAVTPAAPKQRAVGRVGKGGGTTARVVTSSVPGTAEGHVEL